MGHCRRYAPGIVLVVKGVVQSLVIVKIVCNSLPPLTFRLPSIKTSAPPDLARLMAHPLFDCPRI